MTADGDTYVRMAEDEGVTSAMQRVITAPLLAVAAGLSGMVATAFGAISEVISALSAVRDFAVELIATGPIAVLSAGADATAAELAEFGVLAFAVAVGVVGIAWVVWATIDPEIPLLDNLLPWR